MPHPHKLQSVVAASLPDLGFVLSIQVCDADQLDATRSEQERLLSTDGIRPRFANLTFTEAPLTSEELANAALLLQEKLDRLA